MQMVAMQRSKALRNVLVGVFGLVFLYHIPGLYRYTQLRHDIERRYVDASWAKRMVEEHAFAGTMQSLPHTTTVGADRISISPDTGVVTVAFGGLPSGVGETLRMLPIVEADSKRYPLTAYIKSGRPIAKGTIFWACSSSLLRSLEAYIEENSGTLAGELAPPQCRYVTWLDLKPVVN